MYEAKKESYLKTLAKDLSKTMILRKEGGEAIQVELSPVEQRLYEELLIGALLGANWEMQATGSCQHSADTAEFIFMRVFVSHNEVNEPNSYVNMYQIIKTIISKDTYKVVDGQLVKENEIV